MNKQNSEIHVSDEIDHRHVTISRTTNEPASMQSGIPPIAHSTELSPAHLEALLLKHGNSITDIESEGTPTALLLKLLDYAAWDADLEIEAPLGERCAALAAFGQDWMNQFGCTVYEHPDGSKKVLWGHGDDFTWCSLEHVLDAVENGNKIPHWYDEEWTMVEIDGRWVQRLNLEH